MTAPPCTSLSSCRIDRGGGHFGSTLPLNRPAPGVASAADFAIRLSPRFCVRFKFKSSFYADKMAAGRQRKKRAAPTSKNEMETGQQIQFESRQGAQLVAAHLACLICQLAACHRNTQNVTLERLGPVPRCRLWTSAEKTQPFAADGRPKLFQFAYFWASERPTTFRSGSSRWPHLVACFQREN